MIFKTVLEYPLLVALLPLFRQGKLERDNWLIPLLFATAVLTGWAVFQTTGVYAHAEAFAIAHIAAVFICYKFEQHTLRFALCFALLMMVYSLTLPSSIEGANRVYVGRNFFGVKKVLDEPETHLRRLMHGDTLHGVESTDPARMGKPLSYYHPTGPVGDVIRVMNERGGFQHFGVIGLGSGSMAAYADTNHPVTFYEIDPSIEQIARRFFTFLKQCGANCNVVIGDGRLQLAQSADSSLDLLMLDAFSSDSVPTHLVSREALHPHTPAFARGHPTLYFKARTRRCASLPRLQSLSERRTACVRAGHGCRPCRIFAIRSNRRFEQGRESGFRPCCRCQAYRRPRFDSRNFRLETRDSLREFKAVDR